MKQLISAFAALAIALSGSAFAADTPVAKPAASAKKEVKKAHAKKVKKAKKAKAAKK